MESILEITRGLAYRRDPRVRDFLMQSSCVPLTLAMLAYLTLVSHGPRFMKNRQSPPLKMIMTVYNIGQVCLSYYMMREFWLSRPATSLCHPVEVTDTAHSLRLANVCWMFHISKLVDFLDTVFLVLKKDNKRMTYLHVYHHGSTAFGFWLCTLYAPGGSAWVAGMINSFVHCVMYSYYLLASLGPRVRPYLWWKRYLTQLQLGQFAFIVVCAGFIQMPSNRCGLPLWTCSMLVVYLMVLSVLFLNFYRHSYRSLPTPVVGGCISGSEAVFLAAKLNTPAPPPSSADVRVADMAPAPPTTTEKKVEKSGPTEKKVEKSTATAAEEKVDMSVDRVGTLSHFVRAMMSHGMGCFIKED